MKILRFLALSLGLAIATGAVWAQSFPDKSRPLKFIVPSGVGSTGDRAEETSSWFDTLMRIAGLAWGRGVWRNVAEAYIWLMRHYQPGDRLFLFGFSRGAFTARAVSGLLYNYGLLRPEHENLVPSLLRNYRLPPASREEFRKSIQERFARGQSNGQPFPIHFIGMFDTVESVGLNGIFLGQSITSDTSVKPGFLTVRHALAIDELRWPYEQRSYTPAKSSASEGQLKEVWFSGAHCDVGGGYNPSGLSDISLWWMLEEAEKAGLKLQRNPQEKDQSTACWRAGLFPYAVQPVQSEPRSTPIWSLLGLVRRPEPAAHALFHESVHDRCKADPDYASKLGPWLKNHGMQSHGDALANHLRSRPKLPDAPMEAPAKRKLDLTRLAMTVAAALIVAGWAWLWHEQWMMFCAQSTAGSGLAQELSRLQLPVGTLLWSDTLLIAVYMAVLADLKSRLYHFAERRHPLPTPVSQFLPYALAGIYVGDLVENLSTGISLAMVGEASILGLPGPPLVGAFGVLALVACWVKLAGIAIALLYVPYLLGHGSRRHNSRKPFSIPSGKPEGQGAPP